MWGFLRLYFFLVLPLLIMALLPKNPIDMLGSWWFERQAQQEYGAVYPLVMEVLSEFPQHEWPAKVDKIATHFAYSLELFRRKQSQLEPDELKRLTKQGYLVTKRNNRYKLVHQVKESDYFLFSGLYDYDSDLQVLEKQVRGLRYLVNKIALGSNDPEAEFDRLKQYFTLDLQLFKAKEFATINKEAMQSLQKKGLYMKDQQDTFVSYVLSDDRNYVVRIINKNQTRLFRQYSSYLGTLVPAILLALGAILWLYWFRRELLLLKGAASNFGKGQLDTRAKLSKRSTLSDLSIAFNRMAERIQGLLNSHQDMTNAVSHELKTPLSRLRFALEMQKESKSPKDKKYYTKKIEDNIQVLETLINELLGYSRMQREQKVDIQAQNIKVWLEEVISVYEDYHPSLHFDLNLKLPKEITISFDKQLMTHVLNNLLDNAVNYTESHIKVSAFLKKHIFHLLIEDNGKGIHTADYEKVFEPFTRLDKSRKITHINQKKTKTEPDKLEDSKAKPNNVGLGLAIVKSIVGLHKGEVHCENSSLGGAKILISLPLETH